MDSFQKDFENFLENWERQGNWGSRISKPKYRRPPKGHEIYDEIYERSRISSLSKLFKKPSKEILEGIAPFRSFEYKCNTVDMDKLREFVLPDATTKEKTHTVPTLPSTFPDNYIHPLQFDSGNSSITDQSPPVVFEFQDVDEILSPMTIFQESPTPSQTITTANTTINFDKNKEHLKTSIAPKNPYSRSKVSSNNTIDESQIGAWKYCDEIKIRDPQEFRKHNGVFSIHDLPTRLLGYEYVNAKKSGTTKYEPYVIRYKLEPDCKSGEGLCPYCHELEFLKMNDSTYLHHLNLFHGVFSNGAFMPDTRGGERVCRTKKKGKIVHQKGLICPFKNCLEKFIRIKNPQHEHTDENCYRVYWRHCKEKHNKGKKLAENNEPLDDDYDHPI